MYEPDDESREKFSGFSFIFTYYYCFAGVPVFFVLSDFRGPVLDCVKLIDKPYLYKPRRSSPQTNGSVLVRELFRL